MKQFFKFLFASCLGTFLALILLFLVSWAIIGGIASSASKPIKVSENSVLKLDLKQVIPERTNNIPIAGLSLDEKDVLGLHKIVQTINHAKDDVNIKGIYINPSVMGAGQSTVRVLRQALKEFKDSGKFVVAHSTMYTQSTYLLASLADHISLHPFGMVDFRGFAAMVPFFTETMEKLGIKANIYYAGQFKSATEPFRLTKMSPQNKLQTREYINEMYDIYLDQIAESAEISKTELKAIANDFKARTSDDALALNMIDAVEFEEDAINHIKSKIGLKDEDKVKIVTLEDYAKIAIKKSDFKVKDRIAVVFAEGNIVAGEGQEGSIGGQKYSKLLRKLRKDKKVKAVVLRVNSGGGSVLASENILNEVRALKAAGKPVVASFGDVSASGGYYISCLADKILCEPNTITGSIGVFMMVPNLTEMVQDKIGVKFDTVKTGKYSASYSLFYDWTDEEGKYLQSETDKYYDLFLSHVAEGRNMSKEAVHEIAQGRVWSGRKAKEIGLIDELGGLDRAMEITAELAGLEKYRESYYPIIKDPFIRMIEEFTGQKSTKITERFIKSELGEDIYPIYELMKEVKTSSGPQAKLPYVLKIE